VTTLSLRKDSIVLFVARLISGLSGLFAVALLSRFLDVKDYGLYRQWIVVTTFLTSILTLGFPAAITYFLPRAKTKDEEISLMTNIAVSISTVGVVLLLATPLIGFSVSRLFDNDTLFRYEYLLTLSVALSLFIHIFPNLFVVRKNRKAIVLFSIVPNIAWLILLPILVLIKASLEIYVFALLIRPLIDLIIGLLNSGKIFSFSKISWKQVSTIMKFSLPMGLSAIVGSIMLYTDKFVVGSMLTTEEFAVFVNGAYEIPFIGLITASLFTVITPRLSKSFAEERFEDIRTDWIRAGKTLIPIMISITSVMVFFAKPIVITLYSDKYLAAIPVFMIYQSMGAIRIYLYSSVFVASGKTNLYFLFSLFSAVLNLSLDILLVGLIGYIGASLATVIAAFVLNFSYLLQVKRITSSKKISQVFPIKGFFTSIAVSLIISGGFAFLAQAFLKSIFLQMLVALVAFSTSFLLLSKIVSNEILSSVVQTFKKVLSLAAKN
jgi:O-antigen/teichoic acid export membrane protein